MMLTATGAAAAITMIAAAAHLRLIRAHHKEWAARGITPLAPWPVVVAVAAAIAAAVTAVTWNHSGPLPAAAASAAAFMLIAACATDIPTHLVARQLPHVAALTGLVAFASTSSVDGALSLALCIIGLVALPWGARIITGGGLGFSDVRILWALSCTLGWWLPFDSILLAFFAASILQLLALIAVVAAPRAWTGRWRRPRPGNPDGPRKVEIPFAPAITVAFLAAIAMHACT